MESRSPKSFHEVLVVHLFERVRAVVRDKIDRAKKSSARTVIGCDLLIAPDTEYRPANDLD